MAVFVASIILILTMAADHSDAAYCLCSGGGDVAFQKNIDYACGAGADCSAIIQNGACYNPNTVKDHCNYAVNSYYQRKGQVPGSCDFSGTAAVSQSAPNVASGCVYQSSPSTGGSTTPTNNPMFGGTPNANGTTTGTMPGMMTPGAFGPSGFNQDGSGAGRTLSSPRSAAFILPFVLSLLLQATRICQNTR